MVREAADPGAGPGARGARALAPGARFDERAAEFLDQKVEGVLEAPVGICVCCVPPAAGVEVLGRSTIPETDVYSTACAIENLWLTARAEGLGVGWVSFYRPAELRAVLGIPDACRAARMAVRRLARRAPDAARVGARGMVGTAAGRRRRDARAVVRRARRRRPRLPDAGPRRARTAARDRADELVKPAGSLGALEDVVERWAAATGAPPPVPLRCRRTSSSRPTTGTRDAGRACSSSP